MVNSVLGIVIAGAMVGAYLLIFPPAAASSTGTLLTSTVQQGVVSATITASGPIAPVNQATAAFPVSGTIASVNVTLGQSVTAGQVLATLQTAPLQQTVNNDTTLYAQARTQYWNANAALIATESAPVSPTASAAQTISSLNSAKQQVATGLDQMNTASQNLAKDQANLASATLTAPIAGLVIALNGSVGGFVGASTSGGASAAGSSGSALATIADISAMTVSASIAEADIAAVTVGQKAVVTFPAVPGEKVGATVSAIAPTASTSNSVVTYATTIKLDSIPTGLRLGQTASVAITTKSSTADALYVPAAAITTANGLPTVKVVGANGKVTQVTVTLGIVGNAGSQILTGLKVGETVSLGVSQPTTSGTAGAGRTGLGGGFGGRKAGGGFPGVTAPRKAP